MDISASKRSHHPISLAKKVHIIKVVESKQKSQSMIAEEFDVAKSTVSSIMKNKEKILKVYESSGFGLERKRLRTATYCDVEEALLIWFKQTKSLNVPISRPILQLKFWICM